MDSWDEIRTAYHVAKAGTVSGAAEALGVHHATVIRHIDALEARLKVKLFQRHARGYTATEAGDDLLQVAETTDDQFSQLEGRIKGGAQGVTGDLVVTSLGGIGDVLVPVLAAYQMENPNVRLRFLTGERLFRLEYGEAHVAIRAGKQPQEPDNVVQKFASQQMCLVAAKSYIEKYGMPAGAGDFSGHKFVGHDRADNRAPFNQWLRSVVDPDQIVFRTTDNMSSWAAVRAGAGIGFLPANHLHANTDLVEVLPRRDDWAATLWLVTHVDLHRTAKVQSLLGFLKDHVEQLNALSG